MYYMEGYIVILHIMTVCVMRVIRVQVGLYCNISNICEGSFVTVYTVYTIYNIYNIILRILLPGICRSHPSSTPAPDCA
jgi:hypothetical protein